MDTNRRLILRQAQDDRAFDWVSRDFMDTNRRLILRQVQDDGLVCRGWRVSGRLKERSATWSATCLAVRAGAGEPRRKPATMRRFALFLVAALAVASILPAGANTLSFATQKCQVTLPDNWIQKDSSSDVVNAYNPENDKSFVLDVTPGTSMAMDNPALPKALEAGISSQNVPILGTSSMTLANVDFFIIDSQVPLKNQNNAAGYTRFYFTVANNSLYSLAITSRLPNPQDDPELTGIANSFGFIGTPDLPTPYKTTHAILLTLGIGCPLLVLAVIGGIVYLIVRRFRRPKPPAV
jgi:hypothetical protein